MRVTRSADGETHARDRREYRGDGGARAGAVAVAVDFDRATAAFRRSVDEVFSNVFAAVFGRVASVA